MTTAPNTSRSGAPRPTAVRASLVVSCLIAVALVGCIDALTTAYIAFSIFYMPAIILATWFEGAAWGIFIAVAAATAGLVADLSTLHGGPHAYAFVNFGLRLLLFTLASIAVSRLREGLRREQALTEITRETAARLAAVNEIKDELMRAVVQDVRGPLGDIYASAVTLQRATSRDLSDDETRALITQIAGASKLMSDLVNRLAETERFELDPPARLSSVN